MTLHTLAPIAAALALSWTAGLLALVAYQMLTGAIRLDGLLSDKLTDDPVSVARVQGLVATLGLAAIIVVQTFRLSHGEPSDDPLALGDPSALLVLGGSQGLYLWNKTTSAQRVTAAAPSDAPASTPHT